MNQLDDIPLSHTNDSQASFDAGDKVKKSSLDKQVEALVKSLARHDRTDGMTLRELAYVCSNGSSDYLYFIYHKRAKIAEQRGLIKRVCERECMRSHHKATAWRVVKKEQGELF